jgi:gelsolin
MFFRCQAGPNANKPQTEAIKPKPETNAMESSSAKDSQISTPVAQDVKEVSEGEEGLPVYPYDRLRTSSTNPAPDIDVTKREVNTAVLVTPLSNCFKF